MLPASPPVRYETARPCSLTRSGSLLGCAGCNFLGSFAQPKYLRRKLHEVTVAEAAFHVCTSISVSRVVSSPLSDTENCASSIHKIHKEAKGLSRKSLWFLIVVWSLANVVSNSSLEKNSIGFYQMMKILVTPLVVVIEWLLYGKTISLQRSLALLVTSAGVALATVSDVQFNWSGACTSLVAVILGAMHKVPHPYTLIWTSIGEGVRRGSGGGQEGVRRGSEGSLGGPKSGCPVGLDTDMWRPQIIGERIEFSRGRVMTSRVQQHSGFSSLQLMHYGLPRMIAILAVTLPFFDPPGALHPANKHHITSLPYLQISHHVYLSCQQISHHIYLSNARVRLFARGSVP
eukprot:842075-Prorocentrum_minimum.AAC.4